jgi:hypothetical protein
MDRVPVMSPKSTTGPALYELGRVRAEWDLYRESKGNNEDELILRDDDDIRVTEDEHFYSSPVRANAGVHIYVNTIEETVRKGRISYDEVVKFAFPGAVSTETITFKVTYVKGDEKHPTGTLAAGEKVKVHEGMEFSVTQLNRS